MRTKPSVLQCVKTFTKQYRGVESGKMTGLRSVGASQQRIDALAKARGEHQFPSDHVLPGMLWLQVVRSDRPHAQLLSIDTSLASAVDGVVCVLTAANVPGQNRFGLIVADQPVLCEDRVRFAGEPLAIVAAESDEIARNARDLVEPIYGDLPVVSDPLVAFIQAAICVRSYVWAMTTSARYRAGAIIGSRFNTKRTGKNTHFSRRRQELPGLTRTAS